MLICHNKLKKEIVRISKFQNKILYQSKKIPDTFSTSSKRLQDPKWKSRLFSTIFVTSYQTLAQCMCQSSTPIRNIYNLHNILYKKIYIIQYRNHVLNRKKYIQWNILEIFHGTSICQLFINIKYSPICVMCLLCALCSSKQSQVQHVNFIMYVS